MPEKCYYREFDNGEKAEPHFGDLPRKSSLIADPEDVARTINLMMGCNDDGENRIGSASTPGGGEGQRDMQQAGLQGNLITA